MTQFNSALTTAAQRKPAKSFPDRLRQLVTTLRQHCAALFMPVKINYTKTYDEWEDKTSW